VESLDSDRPARASLAAITPARNGQSMAAKAASNRPLGFSLIEVLVATAILATGLIAASRAALVATNDQGILRDRTLARWVAHNTLAEIRLRPQQAQAGSSFTQQAQQSGIEFTATAKVTATPSPIFSRVEVTVARAAGDGQILATAVGFSARP
jgi:general secretion pathway protein I